MACNIPQAKGSRSWAANGEERFMIYVHNVKRFSLLFLHLVFPGFSFSMSENGWTDWCCAWDCSPWERRPHRWYPRELTSWTVGLGRSGRGFISHWRKGSCQGEISVTLKMKTFIDFYFPSFLGTFRSFIPSRSMTHQTTTMLIVRWRRPLTPKLSAFVRSKLLVHHWTDWHWAPRVHPMTHLRLRQQVPCTRTTAHRASIRVHLHSLDDNTSRYFSRLRPLHKRNSAAQNWRTTRNAPTGKLKPNGESWCKLEITNGGANDNRRTFQNFPFNHVACERSFCW